MREPFFVSCTQGVKEDTQLYRSLQKLQFRDYFFFERNDAGLPVCYNQFLDKLAGTDRILVLAHDDVTVADVFIREKLHEAVRTFNVVGLVGSSHFDLSKQTPHYAWYVWPSEYLSGAVDHVIASGQSKWLPFGPTPRRCVAMDGLFLAVDMRTIGKVRFDTQFTFHLYDIDFCLAAHSAGLALGTTNIYVQHASHGNFTSNDYQRAVRDFRAKWHAEREATVFSAAGKDTLDNAVGLRGHPLEDISHFQDAVRLTPKDPKAYYRLARRLSEQNRSDEALLCYRQALRLKPEFAAAHRDLGAALHGRADPVVDDIIFSLREAVRLAPYDAYAWNILGCTLKDMGLLDEAVAALRRACDLCPGAADLHSSLLYGLHFHPDYHPGTLAQEHDAWYARHAEALGRFLRPHTNDPDPDRRLRVGYVSAHFRHSPVGRFLLPLFAAHDRHDFEIFCYASVDRPDGFTKRFRGRADCWHDVAGVTDENLAELVRQDRIDILIDLDAHMPKNRLLAFARKPAPVQVTYLAYCSTTGLRAIDYRLTDPFLDPFDQSEGYVEESVRLPATYWCYHRYIETPVGPLPALGNGHITFGCLNNFWKVNLPTLAAWRDLLQEIPASSLVLLARRGSHRDRVLRFFAEGKVAPDRVQFYGYGPPAQYFERYQQIDIGLDPFHYTGGTTTCDALWMGVPVITLAGKTAMGRGGVSILSNVGLPELVAQTPAEYVRIAASLAADLPRLGSLRAGLRERMLGSAITDGPGFTHNLENAFRAMWQRWCRGHHSIQRQMSESKLP